MSDLVCNIRCMPKEEYDELAKRLAETGDELKECRKSIEAYRQERNEAREKLTKAEAENNRLERQLEIVFDALPDSMVEKVCAEIEAFENEKGSEG